jgi:formylglycine-generating enzyme required for sulfatase activity
MDQVQHATCNAIDSGTVIDRCDRSPSQWMALVPGGTFRMGSDRHYPEEAPVHRVTVGDFWIDRTPVTNREFRRFVNATGYVTLAEIKPDAKDYPGALPHMLKAGSLEHVAFCRNRDSHRGRFLIQAPCWDGGQHG